MEGTWVRSLVQIFLDLPVSQEDPPCHGTAEPVHHNYCALEPMLHKEKPTHHNGVAPIHCNQRKPTHNNKDPAPPKISPSTVRCFLKFLIECTLCAGPCVGLRAPGKMNNPQLFFWTPAIPRIKEGSLKHGTHLFLRLWIILYTFGRKTRQQILK